MVLWALAYYGMTFGSPSYRHHGMRIMDIEMRTWYGSPAYFVLGAVHAIVFWITVSALCPLVLLVPLFNDRRRCLHDMLVGTVVINNKIAGRDVAEIAPPVLTGPPTPLTAAISRQSVVGSRVKCHRIVKSCVTQHLSEVHWSI